MKNDKQRMIRPTGGGPKLPAKTVKALQTNGRMQARMPAQFDSQGLPKTGPFSAAAKQDKRLRKDVKSTISKFAQETGTDITGAQKSKIFDQIDPKNNGPQRGKLGY